MTEHDTRSYVLRRARVAEYGRMMRFIDGVFFGGKPTFRRAWCHIYQPPAAACRAGHLAVDGAEIVGHVGVYPMHLALGGARLRAGGIGAVATDPARRGQGIMSRLLEHVSGVMARERLDISILWGDRQRYGHYGWEVCGMCLEWWLTARHGLADVKAVPVRRYRAARDLRRVARLWNADPCGTRQPAAALRRVLGRPGWRTYVTAAGPFAFATAWVSGDQRTVRVDKACGPDDAVLGLLKALAALPGEPPARVSVVCPAGDHPLARLAARAANGWARHSEGLVKIVDLERTVTKLLPVLTAQHVPQAPQTIRLRMSPGGQSVTLDLGRRVVIGAGGRQADSLDLTPAEAVRLIFGSPVSTRWGGRFAPLNNLFPVPLHVEWVAHV